MRSPIWIITIVTEEIFETIQYLLKKKKNSKLETEGKPSPSCEGIN